MRKLLHPIVSTALCLGVLAPVSFVAAPAAAESPSQRDCEALGGVFERIGGQVLCTIETTSNVGNSPNSQTVTIEDYEGSNGTLNNKPKHAESEECYGPGNSGESSDHCS